MSTDSLLQDLRYTFRTLRRDAGFTAFAVLIVGLGIGASATVFSVANALLLRPLPFTDPGSLVGLRITIAAAFPARLPKWALCSICASVCAPFPI